MISQKSFKIYCLQNSGAVDNICKDFFEIGIVFKDYEILSKYGIDSEEISSYRIVYKLLQEMKKEIVIEYESFWGTEMDVLDNVFLIKSMDKYTIVRSINGDKTAKRKLREWEKILNLKTDAFFRVHKSFIINMKYIEKIYCNGIILKTGIKIPLSRRRSKEFFQAYDVFKKYDK